MRNKQSKVGLLVLGAITLVGASVGASTEGGSKLSQLKIIQKKLDNGLRVVMNPDTTVPTVAVAVYYDVGARNEVKGRSGFAHLFEHMMFQGSANVKKGEHFSLIINRGGSANGTTNSDRTNYFETLPASELALGLWLEADRMKSLAITQDNFENQRQTVMEERRQRIDNQAYVPSMLRINELAYGDYWPYAHSTIGDMEDLERAPLLAVQEFFDAYYGPSNAVVAIAGDFDPAEAMTLLKKYFGGIARRDSPKYDPPDTPSQTVETRETMYDANAPLPAFHLAYHIPKSRTPDHYALEMLGLILGDGESSRFYQALVKETEICQEIAVNTDDRRGRDLFSTWAVMAAGKEPKAAQELIFAEFDKVTKEGVTPRELEKARNRLRSAFVFGLQSNLQRAMHLAEFELYWGDANLIRTELDAYLKVTNEDIQRVAAQYLKPENRTVLDVLPGSGPEGAKP